MRTSSISLLVLALGLPACSSSSTPGDGGSPPPSCDPSPSVDAPRPVASCAEILQCDWDCFVDCDCKKACHARGSRETSARASALTACSQDCEGQLSCSATGCTLKFVKCSVNHDCLTAAAACTDPTVISSSGCWTLAACYDACLGTSGGLVDCNSSCGKAADSRSQDLYGKMRQCVDANQDCDLACQRQKCGAAIIACQDG